MTPKGWTREQLLLAMNLYCRIPFGQFHQKNDQVIKLANAIGRTPSGVAMKLGNLASLDPYHIERGIKGLSGASEADREMWREFHANWEQMTFESERLWEAYGLSTHDEPTEAESLSEFSGPTEAQRVVKVRIAQRFFRRTVMATYQSRCCVSGVAIPELLVASHILPWSQFPEHRADPRNGLCLSRIHDAAFDAGLITFAEDHRLVLSRELSEATSNDVLRECFRRYEGKPMALPERFRPESRYLLSHRTTIFRS